ncbi:MAG TPA: hypothetical protein VGE01_00515, partial [Fimbriimonas sp.]
DPKLDEVVKAPSDSLENLYRKAAAGMLLDDRKSATAIVEAAGIEVLRSEPQDLAANLVSFYFTVKEKSLL